MTDETYEWLNQTIARYCSRVREELDARLSTWKLDLEENEVHEVVGGLLARQCSLAIGVAENPNTWNPHIGPLLLRAMADVHINLAWILIDPVERSQKFIYFGLGQEKLHYEHLKNAGVDNDLTKAQEAWINNQRYMFLTEVNVGSWSEISTRQMAQEANLLDFYRYCYQPLSAAVHSMWNHVAKMNLRPCDNPLHRYHHIPEAPAIPMDLHGWDKAAEQLIDTLKLFDDKLGVTVTLESSLSVLEAALEEAAERHKQDSRTDEVDSDEQD